MKGCRNTDIAMVNTGNEKTAVSTFEHGSAKEQTEIRLMSFNTQHCLNYITRRIDFDTMAEAVTRTGADIAGLQEIRSLGRDPEYLDQTGILAEKLGMYGYFAEAIKFMRKNPYGNALLSRFPIISAERFRILTPRVRKYLGYYETRCLLKAELDVPGGLTLLVTHFGLNPDEQQRAVKTVMAHLPKSRCVLMGDFNVRPENSLLDPIRSVMTDTADSITGSKLSFPSDKPNVKIDYIFVTPDIRVKEAEIPAIVASDHRPCTATILLDREP